MSLGYLRVLDGDRVPVCGMGGPQGPTLLGMKFSTMGDPGAKTHISKLTCGAPPVISHWIWLPTWISTPIVVSTWDRWRNDGDIV